MAVTEASDLVTPQALMAQIISDRARHATTILQTPAVQVVDAASIWRDGTGEAITIRTFTTADALGFVQDAVRNSRAGVTPDKLELSSYVEPVENKTVSIDGDSFAFTDAGMAEISGHLQQVATEGVARAYQRSLITKAMGTTLELDITGESTKTLTVDAILEAKMAWGEWASAIPSPVLFLHSKQYRDLAKTADFKSLASAARGALANAEQQTGSPIIAVVHGVGIALLDSVWHSHDAPAVSSITRSGAVATVTTAAAHGYRVGQKIEVAGATQTEYNGVFTIASVPTATTFTFAVSGSPASPATGAPALTPNYSGLLCAPGALHLMPKLDPAIEMVPHAGSTVKTFDMHFRFATTLVRQRPRGVVKLHTR